jgi:hypothetical protein
MSKRKPLGVRVKEPKDFAPHPAGTLFYEGVEHVLALPIKYVEYLWHGYSTLMARRLIVFSARGMACDPQYYYFPIHKTEKAVHKEVTTILDLLRAGGAEVAEDCVINLKRKDN